MSAKEADWILTADERARIKSSERRFAREEAKHLSLLATILVAAGKEEKQAGELAVKIYRSAFHYAQKKGGSE